MTTYMSRAALDRYIRAARRLNVIIHAITATLKLIQCYRLFSWLVLGNIMITSVVGIITHNNIIRSNRVGFAIGMYFVGITGIYLTDVYSVKYHKKLDKAVKRANSLKIRYKFENFGQ